MSEQIFISYRREGGAETARLVRDALQKRGYSVFLDVEDLRSGPFNTALYRVIEAVSDVVVILSPGSLDRCQNEGDWFRLEVAHAIKHKKNIVPVMTRGFEWPTPESPLPEDLAGLPHFNGISPSYDYFDASMDKLAKLLFSHPKGYFAKRLIYAAVSLLVLAGVAGVYFSIIGHKRETVTAEAIPEIAVPKIESGDVWEGSVDSGIMDLSRDLAGQIIDNRILKLGVLELANNAPGGEILGGDTGCVGRYAAAKVEEGLVKYSQGRYQMVQRQKLDNAASEIRLELSDLGHQESLEQLIKTIPGLDALVLGNLTRMGDVLDITVRVLDPRMAINRAIVSRKIQVTPDLAALFGESAYLPPDAEGRIAGSAEFVSSVISKKAPALHPLGDRLSGIPYDVRVVIDDEVQTPRVKGDKAYVGAPPGKKYAIDLVNESGRNVAVSLFVDGLNTIGQNRELPSEGMKWVVGAGKAVRIRGWQIGSEVASEFVFTEARESLAARRGFYQDIGLITAVYYPETVVYEPEKPRVTTRGLVGTGEGEEIESRVREIRMTYEGTPAAILTLHYDLPVAVQNITYDR